MFSIILTMTGITAASCSAIYFLLDRKYGRRIKTLEHDLQRFSEAMCQMAEIQMKNYRKVSGNLGDIEERIVELAIPSENTRVPLERRRQVLTLAHKGVAIEEITKRLNVPRGEAELILNLRKYMDVATPRAAKSNGELKRHAQG
jgi:hypothetical protein